MEYGFKKYGKYDPTLDRRDMVVEAQEELVDAWNYLRMSREQREGQIGHKIVTYLVQGIIWGIYQLLMTIKWKFWTAKYKFKMK
jgi:hypothetical protein